jgi:hypothetical protein
MWSFLSIAALFLLSFLAMEIDLKFHAGTVLAPNERRGEWGIKCMFYGTKKGDTGAYRCSAGYTSPEDAAAEGPMFHFALCFDGAKSWQPIKERLRAGVNARHQDYLDLYAAMISSPAATSKRSRAEVHLSAPQKSTLNRLNKVARLNEQSLLSRADFLQQTDPRRNSVIIIKRFLRGKLRLKYQQRMCRDDLQIVFSLKSRVDVLQNVKLIQLTKDLKLLSRKSLGFTCRDLIIRDGEEIPREKTQDDDFSHAQLLRVQLQAQTIRSVLERLFDRYKEELKLIEDGLKAVDAAGAAGEKTKRIHTLKVSRDALKQDYQIKGVIVEVTLLAGATYCTAKANNYTDSHESNENQRDRAERFIPAKLESLTRMAAWVSVPYKSASREARDISRASMGLKADDPMPVKRDGKMIFVREDEVRDGDMVKVLVDFLGEEQFVSFREECMRLHGRPGDYLFDTVQITAGDGTKVGERFLVPEKFEGLFSCKARHEPGMCKCRYPLRSFGQDESCYNANAMPKKEWRYNNQVTMRKKTEGQGVMISLFTDDMILSKTEKEEKKMILAGDVPPDPSRYCDRVLAACTDFRLEISALDSLLVANGHLILKGVKCHPEMAGCGVEYIFGSSKRYFRKESDCQASTLNARVMASFQLDVIPLARIWKFERRARLYMLMYRRIALEGADADLRSYEELEKRMASMKSTHRNILEIESSYLKRLEALQELQRGREHVQQEVAVGLIAAPLLAAPQQAVIAAPLLAAPLQAVALINNEEGDLDLWANLDNEEEVGEEAQEE